MKICQFNRSMILPLNHNHKTQNQYLKFSIILRLKRPIKSEEGIFNFYAISMYAIGNKALVPLLSMMAKIIEFFYLINGRFFLLIKCNTRIEIMHPFFFKVKPRAVCRHEFL